MIKEKLGSRIREGLRDMCYIWAKEMTITVKDEGVLIFFILVPILYPLLYSWIYSKQVTREVPVAVVDMSKSSLSRQFIRYYDATPEAKVTYHCNNLEEAKQLVGKRVVKGILYFPSDFEKKVMRGEQSKMSVFCDMSIMMYYKAVYQSAVTISSTLNSTLQIKNAHNFTSKEDEITVEPLLCDAVPIFNSTGGYADSIIPAVLILVIFQTLILGIGLGAGTARESNRYRDLM